MSKNPKNKNQQDRAEREAERRRRDEERAREREAKEAEKARQREERERERQEEEETPAGPPALVLASVQVFGQMPPHQLYVLTDGSTIATPDMDPTLVEGVRAAIVTHFTPPEEEAPEEEIPVEPSPEDTAPLTPEEALNEALEDEDGLSPEDYAALEGATEVSMNLTVPDGLDAEDLTQAFQQALTNLSQKGGK